MGRNKQSEMIAVMVLRTFRDKHTDELHVKGSIIEVEKKRAAEINTGRPRPLVKLITAPPADAAEGDRGLDGGIPDGEVGDVEKASGEVAAPPAAEQEEKGG